MRHYLAIEKVAAAVIKAVRKLSHFLSGQLLTILIGQKSVTFKIDNHRMSKIKNDKMQGWCLELVNFSFDIFYCPKCYNVFAVALSCAVMLDLTHPLKNNMMTFVTLESLNFCIMYALKICPYPQRKSKKLAPLGKFVPN